MNTITISQEHYSDLQMSIAKLLKQADSLKQQLARQMELDSRLASNLQQQRDENERLRRDLNNQRCNLVYVVMESTRSLVYSSLERIEKSYGPLTVKTVDSDDMEPWEWVTPQGIIVREQILWK